MIKNKDDDFSGDEITNNIKKAENGWQLHGTVDRGAVYTKEPLLDLIFEGFNYDRNIGDYKDYVARASTSLITSNTSSDEETSSTKNFVGAKLQHDLYLLDSKYYTSSSTACSKNIYSVENFLKKAIAVSNPIYDANSKYEELKLLDVSKNSSGVWVYGSTLKNKITVGDVLYQILPEHYNDSLTSSNNISASQIGVILDRYLKNITADKIKTTTDGVFKYSSVITSFGGGLTINSTTSQVANVVLKKDLVDFLNIIRSIKIDNTKTAADLFIEDFTLHLHNPDTIKMPFSKRGNDTKIIDGNSTTIPESLDVLTSETRFMSNCITQDIYTDEYSAVSLNYRETLNDLVEEAIFGNPEDTDVFYTGRSTIAAEYETSLGLTNDTISGKYAYLFQTINTDAADKSNLESFVKNIDNISKSITLFCADVFANINMSSNPPTKAWGIFYVNEENTENLFQDKDNSYKIFNNIILGYWLVDALICMRTPLGGFLKLKSLSTSNNTNLTNTIAQDIPLIKRTQSKVYSDFLSGIYNFYPSVSALNNLYKIGHGIIVSNIEMKGSADNGQYYCYDLATPIKEWLRTECILFKGPVYGDYVEELNFMQDLTPDSKVTFTNLTLKKTEIPYTRYQDSKYEVPFVEQTAPLLNNTKDNQKGFNVFNNNSLAGIGDIKGNDSTKSRKTEPPFLYDYDKGDEENLLATKVDKRILDNNGSKQRVNSKSGNLTVEGRILSPTIDELWTFLKYLTESDGSGTDKDVNERLPSFYGIKKSSQIYNGKDSSGKDITENTFNVSDTLSPANRLNPLATNYDKEEVIDILGWKPVATKESRLHYSSSYRPELLFGGYTVTRYVDKIYDYMVLPFNRRTSTLNKDGSIYEYNTEFSTTHSSSTKDANNNLNNTTGYLEKIYNQAILGFDLMQAWSTGEITTSAVDADILFANALENPVNSNSTTLVKGTAAGVSIFSSTNDDKLITTNKPIHSTVERKKAFDDIANILNYHYADGKNINSSLHNHYKEYLNNPKNLKEIERDLETIRQNLQTLAEFMVSSYTLLGYADRGTNRGTLSQLHRNAYEFIATYLPEKNNTKATVTDKVYNTDLTLDKLSNTLNNTSDNLTVVNLDKKVVFEDGDYQNRYFYNKYDTGVIDLDSNVNTNTRARHPIYRANETLMSEVYLAADGTWRSIHEHTVLPVLYDEH